MPPAPSLALAVAALIAHALMQAERTTQMHVQVTAAAPVPAIVPLISTSTKKEFPHRELNCSPFVRQYGILKNEWGAVQTNIPEHEIEKIARCLFLDILAFYNSEEGQ